jgi:hypothetical protein
LQVLRLRRGCLHCRVMASRRLMARHLHPATDNPRHRVMVIHIMDITPNLQRIRSYQARGIMGIHTQPSHQKANMEGMGMHLSMQVMREGRNMVLERGSMGMQMRERVRVPLEGKSRVEVEG